MKRDAVLAAALAPVRAALLAAAHQEADQVRSQADDAARNTVAEAKAHAERLREEARAQGAADAEAALTAERARTGRRARAIVLRAHREEYEALRSAARLAVSDLRGDPEYLRMRQRMIDIIRDLLGREADLREGAGGGVVGESPGRRVDYSLALFADRAVDSVAAGLDGPGPPVTDGGRIDD